MEWNDNIKATTKFSRRRKLSTVLITLCVLSVGISLWADYDMTESYLYPSSDKQRRLSTVINLGGGGCEWRPPHYEVPEHIDFYKTLLVGFPSGDKRMAWAQMEALSGWPAKDEWDFAFLGMSNHPFIKANYPHHEGFWGWDDVADQVILAIPFIMRSMIEYHDILWDLGYPQEYAYPADREERSFGQNPPVEAMYEWRDARVWDEIKWYGWFIDYWMEGGLLRDIFTHRLVTLDHWNALMMRPFYDRAELAYDKLSDPNAHVTPTYDPHCKAGGDISNGCEPVEIISADEMVKNGRGPSETAKIANALLSNAKTGDHIIAAEAWSCIWNKLIMKNEGPDKVFRNIYSRRGFVQDESGFNFSLEMLREMKSELDRLITKYSRGAWTTVSTAERLVELLSKHSWLIAREMSKVKNHQRKLTDRDILGPTTRDARKTRRLGQEDFEVVEVTKDHFDHFNSLAQHSFNKRRRAIRHT